MTGRKPAEPGRNANDLHNATSKPLLPGATGGFDIPHFGKAEEPTAEGTKYSVKIYACDEKQTINPTPAALITTMTIDKQTKELVIH